VLSESRLKRYLATDVPVRIAIDSEWSRDIMLARWSDFPSSTIEYP